MNRYAVISFILFNILCFYSCEHPKPAAEELNLTSAKDHTFSDSIVHTILGKENTFYIQASKVQSFTTKKGIRFTIPANAFITEDGTVPADKVNIHISEYHNPSEILVSGIPMIYNTPSGNIQFESAGMFNIDASANGKRLKLANGKAINVQMPSKNSDSTFNLYNFDTTQNKWIEIQQALKAAPVKSSSLSKQAQSKNSGIMTIEWTHSKAEERMVNGKTIKLVKPECIGSEQISYALPVNKDLFPEISVYEKPQWICLTDIDSKKISEVFSEDSLISSEIIEREIPFNKYLIAFTFKHVTFRMYMKVASKAEQCIKNEEQYNALLEERAFDEKKVETIQKKIKAEAKEADLYRSFSINKLGIWNCDRLYLMPKKAILHPTFRNVLTKEIVSTPKVYLIDQSINTVWTYINGPVTLNPDANNILVFINTSGNMCFARINRLSDTQNANELTLMIDVQESATRPETTDALSDLLKNVSY